MAYYRIRLSGEQLHAMFAAGVSFTDISKSAGVCTERIRQIYRDEFASQFPDKPNGRARMKAAAIARYRSNPDMEEWNDGTCMVAAKAASLGLPVRAVVVRYGKSRSRTYQRPASVLEINGIRCCVRCRLRPCLDGRYYRFYAKCSRWSSFNCPFSVLVTGAGKFFIIPSEDLELYASMSGGYIYIPASVSDRKRKYNWSRYEDRWDYLQPAPATSSLEVDATALRP